jgi:CheY-like chemotaxis protein
MGGAARCSDLMQRLLAFSRRQSLRPETINVNTLVSNIVRLLGRTLGENIAVTARLGPGMWPVKADPVQLEATLVNLAANARDAMPMGGTLNIVTSTLYFDPAGEGMPSELIPGDYVAIDISDTGTGVPPEIIADIFEPFFTTKEAGKGTGLGLSMAFGFAKQSGGHLSVHSEPGLGATFRLYMPRADADVEAPHALPGTETMTGGAETVLVVEDNENLRRATIRQLKSLGYHVREANLAEAALAILIGGDPVDLLFTDVMMPGAMDGLDLAEESARLRPGLRILLTSGFAGVREPDRRIAESNFPLLTKPYRRDRLAETVRAVLDGRANTAPVTAVGAETRN